MVTLYFSVISLDQRILTIVERVHVRRRTWYVLARVGSGMEVDDDAAPTLVDVGHALAVIARLNGYPPSSDSAG